MCVYTGEKVYVCLCAGVQLCASKCLLVMFAHVKVVAGLIVILGKFSHGKLSLLIVCST